MSIENKKTYTGYILLGLMACLVQIQILFGETNTYLGIRINLGDMIIPVAGIIILTTLLFKKSNWPKWQRPCHDLWFFGLLGIIILGVANAYIQTGEVTKWALLNRGIGWGVLTGYIFFAGWSVTNLGEKGGVLFIRIFLLFAIGTLVLGTIWFLLTQYGVKQSGNKHYQAFSGFMGNRNAYAFLLFTTIVIYTFLDHKGIKVLSKYQTFMTHILWLMVPIALMFNGSRAGWIGLGLIVLYFTISKFKYTLRYILPTCIISCIAMGVVYTQNPDFVFRENQGEKLQNLGKGDIVHKTDNLRLLVAEDALELWSDHKILGSGIGTFMQYQEQKRGKFLDQIDNSALWILTETGILGALLFGAFYITALVALWRQHKRCAGVQSIFAQSMIVVMILFGLFSLVHQILYARYLWFLLALALAVPRKLPAS